MVNEKKIKLPEGINLSKINYAIEVYWLGLIRDENLIEQKDYLIIKEEIRKKYQ